MNSWRNKYMLLIYCREKEEIEAMQMAERAAMEEAELAVMEVAGLDDMMDGLDDDDENANQEPEVKIMQFQVFVYETYKHFPILSCDFMCFIFTYIQTNSESGSSRNSGSFNRRGRLEAIEESPMKPLAPVPPPPTYDEVVTSQRDIRTGASATTLVSKFLFPLLYCLQV